MSDQFLGEIRIVSFNFAPTGWAFCNGQLLPLSQNTALFSLLGTTYGGDGKSNFALPNLQGRSPMHPGSGPGLTPRALGESGGRESVTLLQSEVPPHAHAWNVSARASNDNDPGANVYLGAGSLTQQTYGPPDNLQDMAPEALAPAGGSVPHNNRQPYLTCNFVIALQGIFPSRP